MQQTLYEQPIINSLWSFTKKWYTKFAFFLSKVCWFARTRDCESLRLLGGSLKNMAPKRVAETSLTVFIRNKYSFSHKNYLFHQQ